MGVVGDRMNRLRSEWRAKYGDLVMCTLETSTPC